jgi:hypothetical protein
MPQGTVLHCIAHFDNSESNLNNPDPKATVTFGWQSFEEMMVGFFEAAPAREGIIDGPSVAARLNIPFSVDQILAAVLTTINVSILGLLGFRMFRARTSRSR